MKTPKDLKELFETMQSDVEQSHHLSDGYLEDIVEVVYGKNLNIIKRAIKKLRERETRSAIILLESITEHYK